MGKNFWMVVESKDNFEITKNLGFTIYGVGPKFRRRAQRMQPDDQILFYVKGLRKWAATAVIKSKYFTDNEPIWKPEGASDGYPFRVKLEPDVVLEEKDYIDALLLAPRLEYVKRWTPEDWPLAFLERLHLIPQKDFRLIEDEMKRLQVGRKGSNRRHSRKPMFLENRRPQPAPERTDSQEKSEPPVDVDENQSATEDSSTDSI